MWKYEKKLQYPVKIKNPNPKYAKIIASQFGGAKCRKIYITPPHSYERGGVSFFSLGVIYI